MRPDRSSPTPGSDCPIRCMPVSLRLCPCPPTQRSDRRHSPIPRRDTRRAATDKHYSVDILLESKMGSRARVGNLRKIRPAREGRGERCKEQGKGARGEGYRKEEREQREEREEKSKKKYGAWKYYTGRRVIIVPQS